MFTPRLILIAVVAGIVGTMANAVAVNLLAGAPLAPLIFSFGRIAVTVLVALSLIPIFARQIGASAWAVALTALTVVPSVLAKTAFVAEAPWLFVLGVNFVYALAATAAYAVASRGGRG